MHGNVWEWVLDQFTPPPSKAPNETVKPLVAPNTLYPRVVKGGPSGTMEQSVTAVPPEWVLKKHGSNRIRKFPKVCGIILMLCLWASEWCDPVKS